MQMYCRNFGTIIWANFGITQKAEQGLCITNALSLYLITIKLNYSVYNIF
jgi:hypothetical protein